MDKTIIGFIKVVTPKNTYHLCASGGDVFLNGVKYKAVDMVLKDIASKSGQEKKGNEGFTLVLPLSHPLAKELKETGNDDSATGTFYIAEASPNSYNYGVTPFITFTGYLVSTSSSVHEVLLGFGTLRGKLKEEALSLSYSNTCANAVFDSNCKATKIATRYTVTDIKYSQGTDMVLLTCSGKLVDKEFLVPYKYSAVTASTTNQYIQLKVIGNPTIENLLESSTVSPLLGATLPSSGNSDSIPMKYIKEAILNGYIEYFTSSGVVGKAQILGVNQVSPTVFTLAITPAPADIVKSTIDVYMGCDLTFKTCKNAFSNTTRFGGFPFFTGKENPFTGSYLD